MLQMPSFVAFPAKRQACLLLLQPSKIPVQNQLLQHILTRLIGLLIPSMVGVRMLWARYPWPEEQEESHPTAYP